METSHITEETSALQDYHYLNLSTFRKNGTPVVTTVWFAQVNDSVYIWTAKTSGKVKRIRNNPAVQISPSTRLGRSCGPRIEGAARILPDGEQHAAQHMMDRKYGWQKRMFALIWRLQGREQVYIQVTPARD
jgi:PPOX class probable F420-dependent enzyme